MMNVLLSKMTRRRLLTLGLGSVAIGAGGVAAAVAEAGWLEITFRKISGLGFSRPLRVLHLSDFHASGVVPWSLIRESVTKGLAENPDLVFITGDHVSSHRDDISGYPEALAAFRDHPHVYACFGNHDGKYLPVGEPSMARKLEEAFAKSGVRFLHNRADVIDFHGTPIRIAGVGDLWRRQVEPERCLSRISEPGPITLLLAHNPDTKETLRDYRWNVMFSGHTHGGQVVVPVFSWAPVLPVNDKSMIAGLYEWENRHIHITRGVGNLHGIRFHCRPEVSLVDLA